MDAFSEAGDKLGNQRSVFVDVHRKEIFGMIGIFLSNESTLENLKLVQFDGLDGQVIDDIGFGKDILLCFARKA